MFAWYRDSKRCYAYLADVGYTVYWNALHRSKWFTRAWTLQELLAPSNLHPHTYAEGMKFYSREWIYLGSKFSLGLPISEITGIPKEYLEGRSLGMASISMRMSWAAGRQATRSEDIAYSLLGIFDVNMPLLYGEGRTRAFRRLQEEIMKISEDETLFAWEPFSGMGELTADVLATGPDKFLETRDLIPFASDDLVPPYTITHRGLRIWQTLLHTHQLDKCGREMIRPLRSSVMIWPDHDIVWGILRCHVVHDFQHLVIVPLVPLSADLYLRDVSTSVSLIPFGYVPPSAFPREIYIRNVRTSAVQSIFRRRWGFLVRKPSEGIEIRRCFPTEAWNEKDNILQGKDNDVGPSSWHASLELRSSLANEAGQTTKYMIFLSLGCKQDTLAEKPQPWCHIQDPIWEQGIVNLEAVHASASSNFTQHEVRRFRMNYVVGTNVSLKVSITTAKVLFQEMFVVDFHFAELQDNSSET